MSNPTATGDPFVVPPIKSPYDPTTSGEYDDVLPVSLHKANDGEYHLLDRHNDELATFHRAGEVDVMERIVALINSEQLAAERERAQRLQEALQLILSDHINMSKERVKPNRGKGWQELPVQKTAMEALE